MKLPKPKGRQQEVVYLPERGHTVVLGTAGSGKTSMAMLRAMHLQKNHCTDNEGTLVITYNNMLVSYMQSFEEFSENDFTVTSYYKIAHRLLRSHGLINSQGFLNASLKKNLIDAAKEEIARVYRDPIFERNFMVFVEEISWIENFGIKTLTQYENISRIGRKGTRINKEQRKYVWYVYELYIKKRSEMGYCFDWDDAPTAVEEILKEDNSGFGYKHIIIDEGQDFKPNMIRSLAAGIPPKGSLTFFGDVAQQIYGTRISWKDAGLRPPKVWEFKENYRNTKEIAELAIELTRSEYFSDEPDLVPPNIIKAASAKPLLVKFEKTDEYDRMLKLAIDQGGNQQVAILVRKRELVKQIIVDLSIRSNDSIRIKELHDKRGNYISDLGIMVGTYHSAKGLEFDTVIMPFCNASNWPYPERIQEIGKEDTCIEDVRLIYVGITRARSNLIITYTGVESELFPKNKQLYNCRTL